ncbi:helix-turn-helix domain-containing protein [Streptomyces sp. NPDC048191]|uniref:helix-turn-helix domain-containing protein n=1 Tax=Streptomyces sp. NPDC048191 TaxID=3155484 RepID=UPI00340C2DAC
MDKSGDLSRLAVMLSALKERSGLSYAELARRSYTTSSSLHRYCTGRSVPRDYGTVTAVARACGADAEELRQLAVCWAGAAADAHGTSSDAHGTSSDSRGDGPGAAVPVPRPRRLRPRGWSWYGAAGLVALVLAWVLFADTGGPGAGSPSAGATAADGGDTWTWAPWPVGTAEFGVTVNSNTGAMPGFTVGRVRLWDSGTRWADLEPRRGRYDWSALDRLVAGARRAGRPALLTLGGTPAWAAPDGPKSLYADESRTAPPDRPADWDAFVRALATRYRRRLEAYELWDTVTDRHFYSGSARTMAEMARRAGRIIHAVDPGARVVCPAMGRLRTPGGPAFLRDFARSGGYQECDVAAVKVRQAPAAQVPEAMDAEVENASRALHTAGVGEPVWITGPDYDVSTQPQLHGDRARDYAVRSYLVALYERRLHVDRFYFYDWGGTRVPVVLQPEGQAPTAAARGIELLQRWLAGSRIAGCDRGAAAGLPGAVWQCRFTGVRGAAPGGRAVIVWTAAGTASVPAGTGGAVVRRLDGTRLTVPGGGSVPVTGRPELVARRGG